MSGGDLSFRPVAAFATIARALTESLELPEVLRRIASETRTLTDATGVSILLRRGELAEFVAHDSPPPGSLIPLGFTFGPDPDVVAALSQRREPLIILDLHASPLIPAVIKDRIFVRDLIIVPLRVDDELIGVLNIAFNQLPEHWSWDPSVLSALADQAAVAVRNAQLYEAARASSEQLVQAEKLSALGRLVARVTHELNNPLTTARLLAEGLDIEPLPYAAMDQVRALSRELEHAAAVVRDLLLLVHPGRAEPMAISVHELIRATVAEQDRRLAAASVEVALELASDLPSIRIDPHAMRQVMSNLLQNAIHALAAVPEHDPRITIRARLETGDDGARQVVEIADNGPGIPAELRERIFEPFFTTKPLGEGTGLGLAIIKEIIEAHGGTIEVGTAPGGGAVFRFQLPVESTGIDGGSPRIDAGSDTGDAAATEPAAPATAMVQPLPALAPRPEEREIPRGLRVLVIDDEAELQRALRRILLHLGCEVTSAMTGDEGLDHARAGEFDLILCDVRIPGLHGRELFDRLSVDAPHSIGATVFMTGDSLTPEIREFLASTGRPSLSKPFGRSHLENLLQNVRGGGE